VKPESTEQVAAIVRFAAEHEIPLIPYGGATGLMGGAIPVKGGIVIDLKRMDKILRISPEDRTAEVQSGVVLQTLEEELNKHRLLLGHDPWTVPIATIGGTISTNGLGYRGSKYGSMGDQVLGLEVVLSHGKVLKTRAIPKSSTGISLNHLFIGAEGNLGIITAATLRVFAMPEKREMAAIGFPSFEAGFEAIVKMFHIGLKPALVEFGEEYASSPHSFDPVELLPSSHLDTVTDADLAFWDAPIRRDQTGIYVGREAGHTVFMGWLEVEPGQTRTVVLTYELPGRGSEYSLLLQKQPGARAFEFTLEVEGITDPVFTHLPEGSRALIDADRFYAIYGR